MASIAWTQQDLEQMASLGIIPARVDEQIELFKNPPNFIHLLRPATISDGIRQLSPVEISKSLKQYEKAYSQRRFIKFVPASGAATRMFQTLFQFMKMPALTRESIEKDIRAGDKDSVQVLAFFKNLSRLAFYPELKQGMKGLGIDADALLEKGDYGVLLRYLLSEEGLNYSQKPKGLIYFHCYSEEVRTSFEEHLVEGEKTASGVHFTVSDEHQEWFREHHQHLRSHGRGTDLVVDFSVQDPATQTIAVTDANEPFRDENGRLVFRPAGHGALISNLNRLGGDLVFIKNIDNVALEEASDQGLHWKKILGGYLALLQEEVFAWVGKLQGPVTNADLIPCEELCQKVLNIDLGPDLGQLTADEKKTKLKRVLNRPIRVCGVVRNTGEPGGGPFWVKGLEGKGSLQIVESAQIDHKDAEQKAVFDRSTHFNPVDLVCGLRDYQGKPFLLEKYIDHKAVFISQKSVDGQKIKALELPGLWNGAMADWITVFVEVPLETFNPVKTIFDLLKPTHQA